MSAKIVVGQEAIIYPTSDRPELGRVIGWRDDFPHSYIEVCRYSDSVSSKYDPRNVLLIPIPGYSS